MELRFFYLGQSNFIFPKEPLGYQVRSVGLYQSPYPFVKKATVY
jgi:hypothetical protein